MALYIALFALLLLPVLIHNGLVGKRYRVEASRSSVAVMLRKRYDLIPNLVASVQGHMEHERALLTDLSRLRAQALEAGLAEAARSGLDARVGMLLGQLRIAIEAHPELTSKQSFELLMRSLNEIEEQLSAARRSYNACVAEYNQALQTIPSRFVADWMGLEREEFFEAEAVASANPEIHLGREDSGSAS